MHIHVVEDDLKAIIRRFQSFENVDKILKQSCLSFRKISAQNLAKLGN